MPRRIEIVTDTTASLPAEVVAERDIVVVPLQVVIGASSYDETDEEATPARVAEALREFLPVSTSRPAPTAVLEVYERLAREGAEEIVSVRGVFLATRAFKTDAGNAKVRTGVMVDSAETLNPEHALSQAPVWYGDVFELNPATALAWSVDDLNDLQTVIERTE